jgi:hypothetical protein
VEVLVATDSLVERCLPGACVVGDHVKQIIGRPCG